MARASRIGAKRARTGQRPVSRRSSGDFVGKLKWEMGETARLVFPYFTEEDGSKYVVRFGEPYHPIVKKGFAQMVSNAGKKYPVYKVRCTHVFSQINRDDQVKVAEEKHECAWCNIAKYENRRKLSAMEEQFGKNGFKDLPDAEKKAFFKEFNEIETVDASYFGKTDEDGERFNITRLETLTLALQLELEEYTAEVRGKEVIRVRAKKDENGVAVYKPVLVPMSMARETELVNAIDSAIEQDLLKETDLHVFDEGEGDNAVEVNYSFVDVAFEFPVLATKAQSGQKMSVVVQNPTKDGVVTDEFIAEIEGKQEELLKKAEQGFISSNKPLQLVSFEDQINMMEDGGELYYQLEEEFKITADNVQEGYKTDDEGYEDAWDKILGATTEESEEKAEETEKEKPAKKTDEKAPKKIVKADKKEEVKETTEDVEDLSDDDLDDLDELADLDD